MRLFGERTKVLKLLLLTVMLLGLSGLAAASPWSQANSNAGDGYVVVTPTGFDLFGADNAVGANNTTYTFTATASQTLSLPWSYTTHDCCGSAWDPAGYVLNGSFTQLSTNCFWGGTCDTSGTLNVSLNSGDVFGFYVHSVDSVLGRGEIDVTTTPEPGTLVLLGSGVLGLAGVVRRKLTL